MADHNVGAAHLSIGEVLAMLLEEFPDVTISKIRFLESQGLIDPERTASGYRKFYDDDVELLRCILREQRENYLPLRVIKDRLDSGEIDPTGEQPRPRGIKNVGDLDETPSIANEVAPTGAEALFVRTDGPTAATPAPSRPAPPPTSPAASDADDDPSAARAQPRPPAHAEQRPPATADEQRNPPPDPPPAVLPGVLLTADELCAMAGISATEFAELDRYGLLPMEGTGNSVFGEEAVEIAIICKRFLDIGVDTRHLRGWRVAADREAGLIEQLIQPLMRQRNPEARTTAMERMATLEDLGGQLRAAMMRSALAPHRSR
ncbi:MAG: MerR family transcriptional regulator [Actinomycetota bacterium]